jgi:hypothetical protein
LVEESAVSGSKSSYGGIAQLGERLNGIQEVSGSIPLISTKQTTKSRLCGLTFLKKMVDYLKKALIHGHTSRISN